MKRAILYARYSPRPDADKCLSNERQIERCREFCERKSYDIAGEYQRLLDGYYGIEPAEVITAVPLDDKDIQKLTENLSALVGKKIVLKSEVDPGVIGGIVARVGGKLLDGSTRSKLAALRRELVGTERKR